MHIKTRETGQKIPGLTAHDPKKQAEKIRKENQKTE